MGSAGAQASNTEYGTSGTLAQPTPIGVAAGSAEILYAGFWWKPGWTASVLDAGPDEAPAYGLHQNHPNPFGRSTSIGFSLAAQCHAKMAVYDVTGRELRCLIDGLAPAGNHTITWDGRDESGATVSPGVYFYRLNTGTFQMVRKLIFIK
ncbi:FlgD immunoglobulin-like domain containing protein [Candidatus Eisenbacteria bacterium]|uniref:FlgD immunoglobulin-like domain containing protein n=1 Tax=Eiseniibacteriota bacterium TaxID=2212470 RepID=A0ABV6YNF1_UNCEI